MVEPVIETRNLTRTLQGEVPVTLVNNIDVTITQGEFVVVTGPSGSGKSSLLYLLGLLDIPTSGQLFINGRDTSRYTEDERADLRLAEIGFVFQFHFLLPEFSVLENVILPMQKLARLSAKDARARGEELLESLGLKDQMHKLPKQLSGGQSQRVAIARALANDPRLILADEPTGNLDTKASGNVRSILRTLAKEHNRAVIVVTHEADFAKSSERILTIVDGKLA